MAEIIKLGRLIEKASISAMNRAGKTAVTRTSNFIRQKYNFKKRDLDQHIRIIRRASKEVPVVKVIVNKPDISLLQFKAKQFGKPGRSKRNRGPRLSQGVKATVMKGERQLFRSEDKQRGSFIWSEVGKDRGVFIRTGEKRKLTKGKHKGQEREGIVKLFGINLLRLFNPKSGKSIVIDQMHEVFANEYHKRFEHELMRRTNA